MGTVKNATGRLPDKDKDGDTNDLMPLVYSELRKLAQFKMNNEPSGQTLSATALVHEAYLRLSEDERTTNWSNKLHFFNAAAESMRRILIERARAKMRFKRGGELERAELFESRIIAPAKDDEILAVHGALEELERVDPNSAELVKLRYFAGMTWLEISEVTGIPDRTLRRQWTYARAWLKERLHQDFEGA